LQEIKDEILKERMQLERIIIDENEKLMNNGLNSILELNNKLRKLTEQKRIGPKTKKNKQNKKETESDGALSAAVGGNKNQPINDLKKRVSKKPRSSRSN